MEIPECELCDAKFEPGGLVPVCNLCWNKMAEERDALKLQVEEARKVIRSAHFSGYSRGLGPCICKWCVEKDGVVDDCANKPFRQPRPQPTDGEDKGASCAEKLEADAEKQKCECRPDCRLCESVQPGEVHRCSCHTEKREGQSPKKCDHSEIIVLHKCADCGEKIEFV